MRWSDRASAAAGIACGLVIAAAVPRSALADLTSEAEPNGDLVQGKRIFPGQSGVGVLAEFDSDVWTVEGVHAGDLVFAYAAAPPAAGGIDSTLTLFSNERTAAGFEGDTESGRMAAAAIGGGVAPAGGTVQIFVSGDAPIANYWLFQLVAGRDEVVREIEPNDSARTYAGRIVEGEVAGADEDCIAFTSPIYSPLVAIVDEDPDGDLAPTDTRIELRDTQGSVLATGDDDPANPDNAIGPIAPPGNGSYQLCISNGGSSEAGYRAALPWEVDAEPNDDGASSFTPAPDGALRWGRLESSFDAGDVWESVRGDTGLVFALADGSTSVGTTQDVGLTVRDPDAPSVSESDTDDGPGAAAAIAGFPVADRLQLLVASSPPSASVSPYRLLHTRVSEGSMRSETETNDMVEDAMPIRVGELVGGTASGSDIDTYAVPIEAGDALAVIVDDDPDGDGLQIDTHVQVLNPNGLGIAAGDDTFGFAGTGDANAAGPVVAPRDGTYFVQIRNGGEGPFSEVSYRFVTIPEPARALSGLAAWIAVATLGSPRARARSVESKPTGESR